MVAWLLLPRLRVSLPNRRPDETVAAGFRYRIRVRNASWFWAIGDLRIDVRLVITGLDARHPHNSTSLVLPVAEEGDIFPALRATGPPGFRRSPADSGRTFTLRVSEVHGGGVRRIGHDYLLHLQGGDLDAFDRALVRDGRSCYLRVSVSGANGMSGSRRTRVMRWSVADFRTGTFKPGSIKIIPSVDANAATPRLGTPEGKHQLDDSGVEDG